MCEHNECEHSLGSGSHCSECDRIAIAAKRQQALNDLESVLIQGVMDKLSPEDQERMCRKVMEIILHTKF